MTEEVGEEWKQYGLNNLLISVTEVQEAEKLPANQLTITAQILIDVLNAEIKKKERIEAYERKQKLDALDNG